MLLHGLGRTDRAMRPLATRLTDAGFDVHNLRYPSRKETPEALLAEVTSRIDACCADAPVLHLVGHSLGGILIRAYVARQHPDNLGRVVLLAPPNHGSEIVDAVGDWAAFEALLGPTAVQLGTGPDSLPNRLPPPDYDVGVIAGTDTVNPVGSLIIPGEDDGMVSLESTRLDAMTDFLAVPRSHAFIMTSDDVAGQVEHFLRHGAFSKPGDDD